MIISDIYDNMKLAAERIKKVLAELPISQQFKITHSINEHDVTCEIGDWCHITEVVLPYLRDLDAQQGVMYYDAYRTEPKTWDLVVSEESIDVDLEDVYVASKADELFVEAGEGVTVVHNDEANLPGTCPLLVFKRSFYAYDGHRAMLMLEAALSEKLFTAMISPALYIEIVYEPYDSMCNIPKKTNNLPFLRAGARKSGSSTKRLIAGNS